MVASAVACLAVVAGIALLPSAALAAIADQSVAYQQDPQHDGNLTSVPLAPPLTAQWTDSFSSGLSYPLVVNGVVYVSVGPASSGGGSTLSAINEATGATLWSRTLGSASYGWSAIAYDAGRVFGVNEGGLLSAVDAVSGSLDWSVQLPGQYSFSSPPIAVNGRVYVGGAGTGGTLYAVDQQSGKLVWSDSVANGDDSSPAFDGTNIFVTYPCQYYAFNANTGATAWHDNNGCDGGGGDTPVVADGHVFIRDWTSPDLIVNSSTGVTQGPLGSTQAPAVAQGTAFELNGSTLQAVTDDGLGTTAWSFAGDGGLSTAPLVTDGVVWEGSSTGNLYALDPASGKQLWSTNVGSALTAGGMQNVGGLSAGNGALIIPAGDSLVAYAPRPGNGVPVNSLAPTIDGIAEEGNQVAADVGVWTNLPSAYGYQWQRCSADGTNCGDISGASAQTANYTPQDADAGSTLRVIVTATNVSGTSTAVTSSPSAVVGPSPPELISDPTISGNDEVGETLTVSPGSWSSTPTGYNYQWQDCTSPTSCTDISGATGTTYTLQPSDQGETIEVRVTAYNSEGSSTPTEAGPTSVIQPAPAPPVDDVPPTISGTLAEGGTLTVTQGTWLHYPTDITDQWERCDGAGGGCVAISGETGHTYTLTHDDVGHRIAVSESASNALGTGGPVESAPTGVIAAAPSAPPVTPPIDVTPPEVSGLPVPGALVSVAVGQWLGSPISFAYQWELCQATGCSPIPGANSSVLSPTASEDGSRLEVIVTASNAGGRTFAVSSATGPVGTISEDTAALRSALRPSSRSATVRALLRARGAALRIANLETGRLTINWYRHSARRALVATGQVTIVRGKRTFKISLTRAGARMLRRSGRRVRISARGQLVGVGYELTATRQFTLAR